MGVSWGALAGSFLSPFFFGLFSKKVTRSGVWAGFATGVGITISAMIIRMLALAPAGSTLEFLVSPINAGALAMLLSLITVPLVSSFTKKLPSEKVNSIFDCFGSKAR